MNTTAEEINTEPAENLIVEVLKKHKGNPLLVSDMIMQMPFEKAVSREAVKKLQDEKTVVAAGVYLWLST